MFYIKRLKIIKTKVIHHDIIIILVTTKMSEKSLKTVAMVYKNSAINTQVKDHIPLKKQQKLGTQDLSKFENEKEMNGKSTSLLLLG